MAIDAVNCTYCVLRDRPTHEARIDGAPVFESLCGSETCITYPWHPVCLMEYRDIRTQTAADIRAQYGHDVHGQPLTLHTLRRIVR